MPCSNHRAKNSKCSACLAAELLSTIVALSSDTSQRAPSSLHQIKVLQKQYGDLNLKSSKGDDAELCRSLFAALNMKLISAGSSPVFLDDHAGVGPHLISPAHRLLYRARMAQMGTWLGFTEFTVLARMFEVRFSIMIQAGLVWRAIALGAAHHEAISTHALYFSNDHYEVCDSAPVEGGFRCTNIVATNPYGDCGLESFLILLIKHLHHNNWFVATQAERTLLTALRWFASLWRERSEAVIDCRKPEYALCLTEIRGLLSRAMTDAEVSDAIIAEGHLPEDESSKGLATGAKGIQIEWPALSSSGVAPAVPWGGSFAIRSKRVNQAGYFNQLTLPIGSSCVRSFGSNFNASDRLWQSSVSFIAARKAITTESSADNLYSEGVDKKLLTFLGGEKLSAKPMHLGSVMVVITVGNQQHCFACAGVNMHCGNGVGAGATMSIFGKSGDNGLHSEKYCMELVCLLLQGFGLRIARLLSDDLGDTVGAGAAPVKIARLDMFFVNIAPMCETCVGHWRRFRAALIHAGIPEVHGYVWWYAHDIKTWT